MEEIYFTMVNRVEGFVGWFSRSPLAVLTSFPRKPIALPPLTRPIQLVFISRLAPL
jgi:hypothetical protein